MFKLFILIALAIGDPIILGDKTEYKTREACEQASSKKAEEAFKIAVVAGYPVTGQVKTLCKSTKPEVSA